VLYESLVRHCSPFCLWVLCLDDHTRDLLSHLGLEHVRAIPIAELERADPGLASVKAGRLPLEYYWTCGPAFLAYLFRREVAIDTLTYLDADLFFFDDSAPLYTELGAGSVLLIEHRKSFIEGDRRKDGRFNVGLLIFRRTANGLACLERWREQCLEWCFDRLENGRFGDQSYLEEWPDLFDDVVIARHRGAGVAPWNATTEPLRFERNQVMVGDDPLIFYHAGKVSRVNRYLYELHDWRFHRHWIGSVLRRHVYAPYVRALFGAERLIRAEGGALQPPSVDGRSVTKAGRKQLSRTNPLPLPFRIQRFMLVIGEFVL
jgi:hypothetical protein